MPLITATVGYAQVFEITENLVRFEVTGDQLFVRQLEIVDELGDVGADDEYVLAAGDDNALHRAIGLEGVDGLAQIVEGEAVELVDGLTLEVEIQFDDAALKSLNRDGFTFVNHQLISTVWKLNVTCRTSSILRPSPTGVATPGETTPTDTINRADGICVANARFIRPFDLGEHTFMEKRCNVNRLANPGGDLRLRSDR